MSTTTYLVTYRLRRDPEPTGGAVISNRRVTHRPDGSWSRLVAITEGYSTLEDAPKIIAIAHPGRLSPDDVEVIGARSEVTYWGQTISLSEAYRRLAEIGRENARSGLSDGRVTEATAIHAAIELLWGV